MSGRIKASLHGIPDNRIQLARSSVLTFILCLYQACVSPLLVMQSTQRLQAENQKQDEAELSPEGVRDSIV